MTTTLYMMLFMNDWVAAEEGATSGEFDVVANPLYDPERKGKQRGKRRLGLTGLSQPRPLVRVYRES
jgi:hypothetical protein